MNAPRPPGALATARTMARLRMARLRRGRALWLGVVATGLVVAAGLLARMAGDAEARTAFDTVMRIGFRRVLVLLLPFLFCATAISEEVEGRTLVYLFSRPAPRGAMLIGKWLAGTGASAVLLAAGVLATYLGCFGASPGDLATESNALVRALVAMTLGSACYGAMYLLFGAVLVEAPYLLSLLYVGVVELGLGFVPGVLRLASMSHHIGNLLGLPVNDVLGLTTPALSGAASALVLSLATLLFLGLAVPLVGSTEYRTARS